MKVAVGSKNPVKVAAVKRAFLQYFPDKPIDYLSIEAASGVREQPLSLEETLKGAVNRAKNASGDAFDYSVGLEGGIFFTAPDGSQHGIELSWACVRDCKSGNYQVASGPGFPVVPSVLRHIQAGENLNDAMATEYDIANVGNGKGYVGWLSGDVIDRESTCYEASYLALCALLKDECHDA